METRKSEPDAPPPENLSGKPRFKFTKSRSTSSSAPPPERAPKKPSRIPNIHRLAAADSPVTAVNIRNFKALTSIAFDLPSVVEDAEQSPCMILLGENATGKSTVLEAMALAILGTDEAGELDDLLKDEDLSPDDLIHRPDTKAPEETAASMSVDLVFLDGLHRTSLYAEAGDKRFSGDERTSKIVLGYGPRRFFTKRKSRRLRAPAHRVRSLFDPMAMIANPIHWLADLDDQQFYAAARALREVLLLDNDDDFERDADDDDDEGRIYITHHGQRTALKDMSVGYKSVIAMACDIIRELLYHYDNLEFAHGVVFIDEIETHLHPRWKMQIMQLLRKAFPKVQFIVTTHDPLCLRGMYDGEVFVLQRTEAGDTVEKVTDLPSIRGMRAEQILTSEFFGLGSTDPKTDAILIRFNRLLERHESLNDDERKELEALGEQLDRDLVLGSSIAQQAHSAALKKRTRNTVSPTKASSPRRKDIEAAFPALFDMPGQE
ncbi:AAA family ATPase [Ahrensia sp. R2A130]|uniref:AAA family ATPase n=1 Tax=Ahrensia sp. R2A130 TaxID=744979 RepID=UPI0018DDF0DF|nr:AAA family ATPase [Ahrensia sp. R2A130]